MVDLNNPLFTRAYIGATFDIPHFGHMRLIEKARSIADVVIVCLNSDEFVERFKHHRPILSLAERIETVSGFKNIDIVDINFGDEDSKPALLRHSPNFIVFGDDYDIERYKRQIGVTDEWLEENKMKLVQFPYTTEISTTEIVRRCRA